MSAVCPSAAPMAASARPQACRGRKRTQAAAMTREDGGERAAERDDGGCCSYKALCESADKR